MKKYIYLMLSVVLAGILGACSKDEPFDKETSGATGQLMTSSIDVSLLNENGPRSMRKHGVRAKAPAVGDFKVEFFKEGSDEAVESYLYSAMPEIVTLPVGSYVARASYGTNPDAAFDAPYYQGESEKFEIKEDQITDEVSPIVCKFANVCVTILFDAPLRAAMQGDCKVTVKVGDVGTLDYTLSDEDRPGYFAYVAGSNTLAATFTGTIGGAPVSQTKTYEDVKAGNHYTITFRMHDAGEERPGEVSGGTIQIDSSIVDTEDLNYGIDGGDSELEDDMRPQETPDTPDTPDEPSTPDNPDSNAPTVNGRAPLDISKVITVTADGQTDCPVILDIHSDPGIQEFTVTIDSPTLVPLLTELGVSNVLNMADSTGNEEFFGGLGLQYNVRGQHDVEFDITGFLPLLPDGTHKFVLYVKDANGQVSKTVELRK